MSIINPICANCLYRISFEDDIVYVPPEVNDTRRMIIAQDPGKEEKIHRKPLIGPSGKETMAALEIVGLERKDVILTNSCDCSWDSARSGAELELEVIQTLQVGLGIEKIATKPTKAMYTRLLKTQCRKKTEWEIQNYNPESILVMGKSAMEIFAECPYKNVTSAIGGKFQIPTGQTVYITNHPAHILHSRSSEGESAIRDEFRRGVQAFANHGKESTDEFNITIIDTIEALDELTAMLQEVDLLSFDWETTGVDFLTDKITSLSVAWSDHDAAVIDLSTIEITEDVPLTDANLCTRSKLTLNPNDYDYEENLQWHQLVNMILSSPSEKICHNGTFELLFAWSHGLTVNNFIYDTLNMYSCLFESNMYPKTLNSLLSKYCDMEIYDSVLHEYETGTKKVDLSEVCLNPNDYVFFGPTTILPKQELFLYTGKDSIAPFRAIPKLEAEMKKDGCYECYMRENLIQYPTAKMTFNGMLVDFERGKQMINTVNEIATQARNDIASTYLAFIAALPGIDVEDYNPIVQKVSLIDRCKLQLSGAEDAINPKSPLIMNEIFNNMGIYCPDNMKTEKLAPSWREEVITFLLEEFKEETHPLQNAVLTAKLRYEKVMKQLSTYLINKTGDKGMLTKIRPSTGRVHSSFRAYGTETGRPTSKEPNLYNITATDKLKQLFPNQYRDLDIRSLFVAPEGKKIISMDFRQAEVRILAMDANHSQKQLTQKERDIKGLLRYTAIKNLTKDQYSNQTPAKHLIDQEIRKIENYTLHAINTEWAAPMLDFFVKGLPYPEMDLEKANSERYVIQDGIPYWIDIHSWVASLFTGLTPWDVDKETRRKAKTVIFGLNYGMSTVTLADRLGISVPEAEELVDKIYSELGNIGMYQNYIEYLATTRKKLTNIYGQVRHFGEELTHHNLREAIDYRPQSTVSKLMNQAIIEIYDLFETLDTGAEMILTVYDDFKMYCPEDVMDVIIPAVQEIMEQEIPVYGHHLPVDVEIGRRWSEVIEIDED